MQALANVWPVVELATITLDEAGKPKYKIFRPGELEALLKAHGLATDKKEE